MDTKKSENKIFEPTLNLRWFLKSIPTVTYNNYNELVGDGVEEFWSLQQMWISDDGIEEWRDIEYVKNE